MDKYFIITIDTEGDNLWVPYQTRDGYRTITTENAKYLQPFQELCEKYGFITTFLTNYEMAVSDDYRKFAEKGLKKNTIEIGLHTHTWNMPPEYPLTFNPDGNNAYAGDFPADVLDEKVKVLTNILKENFQCDIKSHRGGRWYLDNTLCSILEKYGYTVDCSVTPGVSWSNLIGNMKYGINYEGYNYEISTLSGFDSHLLEIPPTIMNVGKIKPFVPYTAKEIVARLKKKKIWLRPNGYNLHDMLYIVDECNQNDKYLEFMIHSSELMPGGSPTFRTEYSIKRLYKHMDVLFSRISELGYEGIAISDYAKQYKA